MPDGAARDSIPDGAPPTPADPRDVTELEHYRQYLILLARTQIDAGLRDAVDVSGVVQQTFLEAHRRIDHFRGRTPEQAAAWLRQILAHNIADAFRALGAAKRDLRRRRSLDDELARSSALLGGLLAGDQSSPSLRLRRQERAVLVANAMAELPEYQRQALVLQYWHGWTVDRIAARLGRTPAAVAGLLKRGLKQLRGVLHDAGAT
jgi:RNA polymerase sigma-70 factor (ECF subfamily)